MNLKKKIIQLYLFYLISFIYTSTFTMNSLREKDEYSEPSLRRNPSDRKMRKIFSLSDEKVLTAKVEIYHTKRDIGGLMQLLNSETPAGQLIIYNYFKLNKLQEYIDDAHKSKKTIALRKLLIFFEKETENKNELQTIIDSIK